MTRYHTIIVIFIAIIATIIFTPVSNPGKVYIIIVSLSVLIIIMAIGSICINSQLFVTTVCKVDSKSNSIGITFDDGPDTANTPEILNILRNYGFKASFFIVGKRVENSKDIIEEIYKQGHSIGNHSYSHANVFPLFSVKKISAEILKTNIIIEEITGERVKYFRPPFGVTNPRIRRGLQGLSLIVVGWSIRSFDTRNEKVETVVKRITKRLTGGDIVLLHDSSDNILEILEQLLQFIKTNQMECVSLEKLLKD